MTGYEQFLVVVLASFLAIFLILGIIFLIIAIKVVLAVKRITQKAEQLTDKAEAVGEFIKHASAPLAIARALSLVTDTLFRKSSKRTSKRKG